MNANKPQKEILKNVLKEQWETFSKTDLGVEREALKEIVTYQRSPYTVVISGLRRVGKSTLLAQIANKYYQDRFYYINFEDERLLGFQSKDFDLVHETLIEFFGEKKVFFLDEIQNVPGWERFVRRLSDQGYKFYLTGSNASLLSQELGTKLTGRYLAIELFPFSFREFLKFKNISQLKNEILTTVERGKLKRVFNQYISQGGIPDAIKYPQLPVHKTLYNDILYRDVAARFKVEAVQSLKELAFYLMSNTSSLISYNKLKELLKLGSVNTVVSYVSYLETSWLMFVINAYAYSVKKQQIAAKKIYSIDTGLTKSVAFAFSENRGKFLENTVFLALRKKSKRLYYLKTQKGLEVDFYNPETKSLVQVAQSLSEQSTKEREIQGLVDAAKEMKIKTGLILTEDVKDEFVFDDVRIRVEPLYQWLLEN